MKYVNIFIVEWKSRKVGFCFFEIVGICVFYLVLVCIYIIIGRVFYDKNSSKGIIWCDEFCFVVVKRVYVFYNKRFKFIGRWISCYIFKFIFDLFLLYDIIVWDVFYIIVMIGIIEYDIIVFLYDYIICFKG